MQFSFNAQQYRPHDPDAVGTSWAIGEHPFVIKSFEPKPVKDNDGGYMELTVLGIAGVQEGTNTKIRLHLWNKNETAVRIANEQLSALCHHTGVFQLNSTDDFAQFIDRPVNGVWRTQKNNPQYTEFAGFKVYNPAAAGGQQAQQQTQQAPQQQNAGQWAGGQQQQPAQQPQQSGQWSGGQQQTQQQTQPAQQPQQQPQQWQGNQQPAQQQQPAQNGGWQGGQQAQQPAQQQAPQNNGGGWQPNNGGAPAQNGKPAWA